MGIFPGLGSWINQNLQQRPKDESKRSRNVKSKSKSEMNTHMERDEMKEQLTLWRDAEKKKQWNDDPLKMKAKNGKEGVCKMNIEFTMGLPPQAAYDVLTNPDNLTFSRSIKGRELLENISRKVTMEDTGQGESADVEKHLTWNFLWFFKTIPLHLSFIEDPRDLSVLYRKQKNEMKFMENFRGEYKVEPIFVDAKRLCNHIKPKNREEYDKCSGRKGKIASKVIMEQSFKPSYPFNLPLISWYVRRLTIDTTKKVIEDLQGRSAVIRSHMDRFT